MHPDISDELDHEEKDDDRSRSLFAIGLGLLLVVTLILGSMLYSGGSQEEPVEVIDTASGCRVHPLKYTVTDDPEVFAEQKRFEQDVNVLPNPAFYREKVDIVAARHAASHEYVVVFYGDRLEGEGRQGLIALGRRAVTTKAPVIVAPDDTGDEAIVALARGYQLTCREGGRAQAAEVTRFASQLYASLADPDDPVTTGPAPASTNRAPSPTDRTP